MFIYHRLQSVDAIGRKRKGDQTFMMQAELLPIMPESETVDTASVLHKISIMDYLIDINRLKLLRLYDYGGQ
jgi:hypothetical protein